MAHQDKDDGPVTQRLPSLPARSGGFRGSGDAPATAPGERRDLATYEVIIFYQEPTFAEHAGLPLKTYQGTFRVSASDAEEAKTHAIASFRRIQSESSVSWERNIVDITCCKVS